MTDNGETLRRRVLWRGDAPVGLDSHWSHCISSLQLRTVVDLRSQRERARRPYDASDPGCRIVAIAVVGDTRPADISFADGFADFNRWVLETRGHALGHVLAELARPGALPALVHCTAGKDRTGVLIALVQAWLGVPDSVIARDYSLSAELLHADTEEAIEQQRLALGVDARSRPELLQARPEWIVAALDWLRDSHGTPESYLLAHGVRQDELEQLRQALLLDARVGL